MLTNQGLGLMAHNDRRWGWPGPSSQDGPGDLEQATVGPGGGPWRPDQTLQVDFDSHRTLAIRPPRRNRPSCVPGCPHKHQHG